ncbi:MAG: efflux RND transporter periplasmic adaptor subunit [Coleofasciculaceae cyanobacterium SM2_1_6]|nr:efflux RND transporter periplasmic adaptor subunit [Coleofasciculaceae cyanobacterium SM2_1_6]
MSITLPSLGKPKKSKTLLIASIAAGVILTAGIGLAIVRSRTPAFDLEKYTVTATSQNLEVNITASGTVVPIQSVNISPKTAGRITRLFVEQGDQVTAGQRLAQMETTDLQADYLRTQANLDQAEARLAEVRAGSRPEEIAQARARLEQAQARLAAAGRGRPEEIAQAEAQVFAASSRLELSNTRLRQNQTLEAQGAVSQDALNQSLAEQRDAQANLFQAEQRLQQARSGSRAEDTAQLAAAVREARAVVEMMENGTRSEQIDQAAAAVGVARAQVAAIELQLNDATITAPFDGIVSQKYANEGAFVTPTVSAGTTASATSASILAIARGLEILASVPEVDVGRISQGQRVEIIADAYPGEVFVGRVNLVAPEAVVEQNVTSFQVRITLETGKDKLRSNMNVDTRFLGEQVKDALVVPTVAIVTEKGRTGVLIPGENNQPTFKPVTIGQTSQDKTQILEGLTPQERVFINLPPGVKREEQQP